MHQAFVYSTKEEFVSTTVPFVQEGIVNGEPVFVVTDPARAALVRDALGGDAERVSFRDHTTWYDIPARRLNEYYRLYSRWQQVGAGRIRIVGEPVWSGRSDAQVREWKRFESLVNVVFAGFPVSALCAYDAHALPASIVADAHRTHPELLAGSRSEPNQAFVDPAAFTYELDAEGLGEPEVPSEQLAFRGDLAELRKWIVARAIRARVEGANLAGLEWAANEIATNVLRHAGGEAGVRTWSAPGEFVCEIADRGGGIEDPLVGRLPPDLERGVASGLWLVHQLCDLVEVHSSTSGSTVRLHVMLGPPTCPHTPAGRSFL